MDYNKFIEYERRALSTVYTEGHGGFHDTLIPKLANKFLPEFNLDINARIADIGCGTGMFMSTARDLGFNNCIGVTLSQEDVDACITQGFTCVNASMSDLPFPDNELDFIWCRHALEHSPYPLFTLYEFHRALRSGGTIYIEVPAPNNEREYVHEYNPNHYSILGERMWTALFQKAGFTVAIKWDYHITVPMDGRIYEKEASYVFGLIKP